MAHANATQTTELVHVRATDRQQIMVPGRGQAEMVWKEIKVEESMTYSLGKDRDGNSTAAGVLSNVWDFIAAEKGISFDAPEVLEETEDKVTVRVRARYFNSNGQEVQDAETYTIDCRVLYQLSRLKWEPFVSIDGKFTWAKKKAALGEAMERLQAQGYCKDEPEYDDEGIPTKIVRRLPPDAEKSLWENFLTLKRFKLAKAVTCAHRRITQRAVGTKVLDPSSLTLKFPAVFAQFSEAQIQQAAADLYGEEDSLVSEVLGTPQGSPAHDPVTGEVQEAEYTAPRQQNDPGPAGPPPQQPAPEANWQQLVGAIVEVATSVEGPENRNQRMIQRMAGWNDTARQAGQPLVCAETDGSPSLRACSVEQLQEILHRYQAAGNGEVPF